MPFPSPTHASSLSLSRVQDGYALPRDPVTSKVVVDPALFPSGFRNLSDTLHRANLLFGVYTSIGPLTCLGYQPTQPKRPGSCGFEEIDAETYAVDWQVDQVSEWRRAPAFALCLLAHAAWRFFLTRIAHTWLLAACATWWEYDERS